MKSTTQSDVKRSLVPVVWADAPAADGQFWQAEAELKDGEIFITKAVGPFDPPPKTKKVVSVPPVRLKLSFRSKTLLLLPLYCRSLFRKSALWQPLQKSL